MAGHKIIGITGVMGSGKSEVSAYLSKISGFPVCNADELAHTIYQPGSLAWRELVNYFGQGIVNSQGEINRPVLGAIVFNNHEKLQVLGQIVHPPLVDVLHHMVANARNAREGLILDAALLFELSLDAICDEVWVVDAPEDIIFQRLAKRSGISQEDVQKRLGAQLSSELKKKKADHVIQNDSDYEALTKNIDGIWLRVKG